MRKTCLSAAAVLSCLLGGWGDAATAWARDGAGCGCESIAAPCDCGAGGQECSTAGCGLLGCGHGLLGGHAHSHHYYEGADLDYNCGCNGSYKFPVPPLYTYFWPGLYSQQLMTDYHYPKRFPPLKPYTDEADPVKDAAISLSSGFGPVSSVESRPASTRSAKFTPMSERMIHQVR